MIVIAFFDFVLICIGVLCMGLFWVCFFCCCSFENSRLNFALCISPSLICERKVTEKKKKEEWVGRPIPDYILLADLYDKPCGHSEKLSSPRACSSRG